MRRTQIIMIIEHPNENDWQIQHLMLGPGVVMTSKGRALRPARAKCLASPEKNSPLPGLLVGSTHRLNMPASGTGDRLDHSDTPGTEGRKLILKRARQARYYRRKRQQCQDHPTTVRFPQCPQPLGLSDHHEKLLAHRKALSEQEVRKLDLLNARQRKFRA